MGYAWYVYKIVKGEKEIHLYDFGFETPELAHESMMKCWDRYKKISPYYDEKSYYEFIVTERKEY